MSFFGINSHLPLFTFVQVQSDFVYTIYVTHFIYAHFFLLAAGFFCFYLVILHASWDISLIAVMALDKPASAVTFTSLGSK